MQDIVSAGLIIVPQVGAQLQIAQDKGDRIHLIIYLSQNVLQSLYYFTAEGGEGDVGELEVLLAEGDADDGDVEQHPEEEVRQHDADAAEEEPQNVHQGVEASRFAFRFLDLFTEWPQSQHAQLEYLHAEGDADDGYTQHYA